MCQDRKEARISCLIRSNREIAEGIYEMVIEDKDIASQTKPGQFINLYCASEALLLPRPISICEVDVEQGWVKVVYAVISKGTQYFATLQGGEKITVLGPVGNGYTLRDCEESLIVGGGVGTPPLLELVKQLKGRKTVYLGFRSNPYLIEELGKYATVHVATDDGSVGYHGTVVDLMNETAAKGGVLYACGPKPMLKALQAWAGEKDMEAQLSLEERMGCGFGACVGCACKVVSDNEYGYTYKKVCKDGPIFDAKEVLFE